MIRKYRPTKEWTDMLHRINYEFIRQVEDAELKYLLNQCVDECRRRGLEID